MIPVGTRREAWSALDRAQWLWGHHHPVPDAVASGLPRVASVMRPTGWRHQGEQLPLGAVAGTVDLACGLARPEGFVCTVLRLGLELRSLRLVGDHRPMTDLPSGCVVSAKDAARLSPDADVWVLETELVVDGGDALLSAIRALLP